MNNFVLNSPLEQFDVFSYISVYVSGFGSYSFTNLSLYDLLAAFAILFFLWLSDNDFKLIPNGFSNTINSIFDTLTGILSEQLGYNDKLNLLPFISTMFIFILVLNLNSNIPYSFAVTSSGAVTLGMSFMIWLGCAFMSIEKFGINYLNTFVPTDVPVALYPLLTPVETISNVSRAISLGTRLLCNIVAGHAMLYMLSSFIAPLFSSFGFGIILGIIGVIAFSLMVALEVAVSFIQAYVWTILTSSYIKDATQLH